MAKRDRNSQQPRNGRTDERSDSRGRGGYGDSSGFSGGTRASSDEAPRRASSRGGSERSGRDEQSDRPDVGMRGRSTRRSEDEGMR